MGDHLSMTLSEGNKWSPLFCGPYSVFKEKQACEGIPAYQIYYRKILPQVLDCMLG